MAYDYNDKGYREHRYAGANRVEYGYTTAGQLLGVGRQVFVNDAWIADENAPQVTYQLDALGRRVEKRVGNDVEKYLWAGHNMTLLAVYDAEDDLVARFEYGAGRMPVRMTQGEDTYYFA
ncbi:MAG: hypothetical protein H3C30_15600, partial [Candidatus Hydrogenedentes bacterium]|nr:hypothetical protein [Candidatus Hydrogenedentota bacterium]